MLAQKWGHECLNPEPTTPFLNALLAVESLVTRNVAVGNGQNQLVYTDTTRVQQPLRNLGLSWGSSNTSANGSCVVTNRNALIRADCIVNHPDLHLICELKPHLGMTEACQFPFRHENNVISHCVHDSSSGL